MQCPKEIDQLGLSGFQPKTIWNWAFDVSMHHLDEPKNLEERFWKRTVEWAGRGQDLEKGKKKNPPHTWMKRRNLKLDQNIQSSCGSCERRIKK